MRYAAWLESVALDTRHGLRQLVKTPVVTGAVVLSLAVGIGANTAIFGLVDAALLRPLPVPDPDRLIVIEWSNAGGSPPYVSGMVGDLFDRPDGARIGSSVSAPLIRTLAREQTGLEAVVGIADPDEVAAAVGARPAERAELQYVSANFFQGLNVVPVLGRPFLEDEDRVGEPPAVVVSHRYFRSRLGGSPDALGRALRINDVAARIVGVAPPGFFGLRPGQWTDLYAPLAARSALDRTPNSTDSEDPTHWWVRPVGRLGPDVSESAAMTELNSLFRSTVAEIAGPRSEGASIPNLFATPGRRGLDALNDQTRAALWLLMLLVALLLSIVCANVANLLLARAERRQRESAVRLALGAHPARLFRLHSIEAAMLALAGGAAGLVLGFALSNVIHELFQTGRDPSDAFALQLDWRVVGYTTALSMVAALLFGSIPALRAARSRVQGRLGTYSRSIAGGRLRGPSVLVCAQLALCLSALVAAGLLGGSLQRLTEIDFGFDPENLVYASVNPWFAGYSAERIEGYISEAQRELEALPGVASVSFLEFRPFEGGARFSLVNVPGRARAEGFDPALLVTANNAGPGVLETLGIPLQAGRTPNRDEAGVVVDERFVERFFDGQDALGRRFGTGAGGDDQYEIVGIARNAISLQLRNDPLPTFYLPYRAEEVRATHLAIRTSLDPNRLLEAIRGTLSSMDPAVPLTELRTQTELFGGMLRTERMLAFLSAGFGLLATGLAAIGLAGLLAYAVARRTNEIGLRMALGAAPGRIVRMVMRDAARLVVTGLLIGVPCAYGIAKLMESSLYELAPSDPATLAASMLALLAISFAAACLPARRAASTDPMAALRQE